MEKSDAERLFKEADALYRTRNYERALPILETLNDCFPHTPRLMYPLARCLAHLGRHYEANVICEALVTEFNFDRAGKLMKRLEKFESDPGFSSNLESDLKSWSGETTATPVG